MSDQWSSAFSDAATVLTTRQDLDDLLAQAMTAPGIAGEQTRRIVDFVREGHLARGEHAYARLAALAAPDRAHDRSEDRGSDDRAEHRA